MATERKKINFTEKERGILIDLVTRESNVLENKRTDAVSLSEKKKRWQQIEEQFNSNKNGVHPRTENQLRKCRDNLKEKWRRTKATGTKELFRTGGGKAADSVLTEELQRVGAVASHMSIRIDNAFDSDRARHDVPASEATAVVTALLSSMQPAAIPEGDGKIISVLSLHTKCMSFLLHAAYMLQE
nr:myb/SANT-like DNA-binding domain-containing protein 3 [Dermacentor andersoni]